MSRLHKFWVIFGVCVLACMPLLFISYPKSADADSASCAVSYIANLLGWGTAHTTTSAATGATVGAEVTVAHGVIATAVTSETLQVGVTNPNEATQLASIAAILGAGHAQQVEQGAQGVTNTASNQTQNFTNCIVKPLVIMMAQRILANITSSLITWIQNGFNGSPSFVTNIDDLVNLSANQAIGEFIQSDKLAKFLCSPFSLQIRIALATQFSGQAYNGCTLTQVEQNIKNFGNTESSWSSWLQISTVPANNIYGSYIQASGLLADQLNSQFNKINNELNRNGGFLDFKVCDQYAETDDQLAREQEENGDYSGNLPAKQCTHYKTETPGSAVQSALAGKYQAEFQQIGVADDINQIIGALINEMINKTLTGPGGLLGAKTSTVSNTTDISSLASSLSASNASTINDLNGEVSNAQSTYSTYNQGGTNAALSVSVSASSVGANSSTSAVDDGDANTVFISGNEKNPSVTLDLGSSASWDSISIYAPNPIQTTLGKIKVEISDVSTFDPTDASTMIFDASTGAFVPETQSITDAYTATSSSTFTISTEGTGEFIRITKDSDTAIDTSGECESGQEDSSGNCTDPLEISEINVIQSGSSISTNTSTASSTDATANGTYTAGPTASFSANPSTSPIIVSATTPTKLALSVSTAGSPKTPLSAEIFLTPETGAAPITTAFTSANYALMQNVNGNSVSIDSSHALFTNGAINLTNIPAPVELDLSLEASGNGSGIYDFIVKIFDANGNDIGTSNPVELVVQ